MKNNLLPLSRTLLIFLLINVLSIMVADAQYDTYYKPFYNPNLKTLPVLKKILARTARDTSRVKYLLAIADYFMDQPGARQVDMDSVGAYLKKAYALASNRGSEKWKHNTLMLYGQFYAEQALPDKQKEVYSKAIFMAQKSGNKALEADSWFYFACNLHSTPTQDNNDIKVASLAVSKLVYHQSKNRLMEAFVLKQLADYHLQQGSYDRAEKEMLTVLAYYKSINYKYIYYTYDLLSAIYNHKGDLSKALYYALCTLKSCEKENKELDGIFLRRLAEAYSSIGKRKESIEWYVKSFEHYANRYEPHCLMILSELTTELIYNGEAGKALDLINKTKRRFPDKGDFFTFWFNMAYGECYTALGQFAKAAPYIDNLSKRVFREPTNDELDTQVYFNIGKFYFAQKKYDEAHTNLQMATKTELLASLPVKIRLYQLLYQIDMIRKNPSAAIVDLQKFHKLQDSVFTQEKTNTIERLQIEYNASQKESENELLRKKSELQSQQLGRDKLIKRSTFFGLVFLSVVLILLYSRFNLKKRVNKILVMQKKSIDLAYAKLEVSIQQKNKLIDEKEGLIKEVHHRVKNNLQLTMSLLNSQSYYLEDPSAIAAIRESQHRIKSIALIHQKLYQTENVATININPYVSELVDYLRDSIGGGKQITFEMNLMDLEMDIAQAVPLGLFLNEAITNIFKYAFPGAMTGHVQITLQPYDNTRNLLRITDNGIGLPEGFDNEQSNTLGMTLMKGLSTQMDGDLVIESKNGLSISLIFENTESLPITL